MSTPRASTPPVLERASQMLRRLFSTIAGRGDTPLADHLVTKLVTRQTTRIADVEVPSETTGCIVA